MPTPEAPAAPPSPATAAAPAAPPLLLGAGPWLELGCLVGAALFALQFHARLPSRLPSDDDHRALAAALGPELAPGDGLVLWPWWTERARLFLPEGVPLHGYLGVERDDLVAHPRLWVVGQPELPHADRDGFFSAFSPGRSAVGTERRFGTLSLQLFVNGRHRPVRFSAVGEVERARVYLERPGDGARQDCPLEGARHRCPGPPHLYVAAEWHELLYAPRRCLWMHAPGGPTRLVAEFPDVPQDAALLLEAGVIWEHAHRKEPRLTPVQVTVEDAGSGQRRLDLLLPPGLEGVQRAQAEAAPASAGDAAVGTRTLKLTVQSDNAEARQVCVELRALGPPGTGAGAARGGATP